MDGIVPPRAATQEPQKRSGLFSKWVPLATVESLDINDQYLVHVFREGFRIRTRAHTTRVKTHAVIAKKEQQY